MIACPGFGAEVWPAKVVTWHSMSCACPACIASDSRACGDLAYAYLAPRFAR